VLPLRRCGWRQSTGYSTELPLVAVAYKKRKKKKKKEKKKEEEEKRTGQKNNILAVFDAGIPEAKLLRRRDAFFHSLLHILDGPAGERPRPDAVGPVASVCPRARGAFGGRIAPSRDNVDGAREALFRACQLGDDHAEPALAVPWKGHRTAAIWARKDALETNDGAR
jgi:hypothetical protein